MSRSAALLLLLAFALLTFVRGSINSNLPTLGPSLDNRIDQSKWKVVDCELIILPREKKKEWCGMVLSCGKLLLQGSAFILSNLRLTSS